MTENNNNQSCIEFQDQLAELIGSRADLSGHAHLATCENCRALLSDLMIIAEKARELLPTVEPPDDLWANIEQSIRTEEQAATRSI